MGRKGVDRSIRLIGEATQRGANLTFDIIGDGPDRALLERLADTEGLANVVRFRGLLPYGPELLRELASYDGLLFTPLAEDTPRMIFDGYAAGLPLIGAAIDYVQERPESEGATVLLPLDDDSAAADELVALSNRRDRLASLAKSAMNAAVYHAADSWYRRRAEWTFEAVERHRSGAGGPLTSTLDHVSILTMRSNLLLRPDPRATSNRQPFENL